MTDAGKKLNLTQRILALLSVNYSPHEKDPIPMYTAGTYGIAEILDADEDEVTEECEFLWIIGVLHKDNEDKYSLWW
jgi:hypothetical protein